MLSGALPSGLIGQRPKAPTAANPLNLLILGGTGFVGPHLVEAAQRKGHSLTLFNRGKTNPHLFPDLEKLKGDRDPNKGSGLQALEQQVKNGRRWDAVIDTSGYVPRIVAASASLLTEACSHYQFISTLSVYADRSVDVTEDSPVIELEDPTVERVSGATYGGLKVLCENAAEKGLPGRTSRIRPGLIVGPMDRTDRFTWWPHRIAKGGEVLAPGQPDAPVQFIDVRDLSGWCIELIENKVTGVLNAIGPSGGLSMQEFLHGCKVVSGSNATFTWVKDSFLQEHQVRAYTEIPLWIPREGPPYGTAQMQNALQRGLKLRPPGDTIRDTLEWSKQRPEDHPWRAGLRDEKEALLLQKWRDS